MRPDGGKEEGGDRGRKLVAWTIRIVVEHRPDLRKRGTGGPSLDHLGTELLVTTLAVLDLDGTRPPGHHRTIGTIEPPSNQGRARPRTYPWCSQVRCLSLAPSEKTGVPVFFSAPTTMPLSYLFSETSLRNASASTTQTFFPVPQGCRKSTRQKSFCHPAAFMFKLITSSAWQCPWMQTNAYFSLSEKPPVPRYHFLYRPTRPSCTHTHLLPHTIYQSHTDVIHESTSSVGLCSTLSLSE